MIKYLIICSGTNKIRYLLNSGMAVLFQYDDVESIKSAYHHRKEDKERERHVLSCLITIKKELAK